MQKNSESCVLCALVLNLIYFQYPKLTYDKSNNDISMLSEVHHDSRNLSCVRRLHNFYTHCILVVKTIYVHLLSVLDIITTQKVKQLYFLSQDISS